MGTRITALLLGVAIVTIPARGWAGSLDATYHSTVRSGSSIMVDRAVFVNPDCTIRRGTEIKIVSAPVRGTASIAKITEYSFRSADPRSAKCEGKKLGKVALFYKSKPGFVGEDHLVARRIYPDGSTPIIDTVIIDVAK